MGTFYHVTLVTEETGQVSEARVAQWADAVFDGINQGMSTYLSTSELSRINQAQTETVFAISQPLSEVLAISERVSRASNGAFDITVAPLVNLWGFGPKEHNYQAPSDEAITEAMANMGHANVIVDVDSQHLTRPEGYTLDLSAVAKGYASDQLAAKLKQEGFENFLVEVGGEVVVNGVSPRGDAWTIGIETPSYGGLLGQQQTAQVVALTDMAMATSGDYRNYYEIDGKRYSHTIDPRTGRPIQHTLASVTVLAKDCASADAWATALNVLGPEEGFAVAKANALAAFFIVREGEGYVTRWTQAFEQYNQQ